MWLFVIWLFRHSGIWAYGYLGTRVIGHLSIHLDIWPCGHLAIWAFGYLGMRLFGNSGIWSFVPLVNWAFGHVVITAFGNMGIWKLGHFTMVIWIFGNWAFIGTFGHVIFGQLGI